MSLEIDYNDLKELGRTGEKIPAIGLGTWGIGGSFAPDYSRDDYWIKIIRKAIELGIWMIDTAEMYAKGHAEELVGRAIKVFERDEVFIITKVWPDNYTYEKVIKAAKASLKRLDTNYIDLYLLHWPTPDMPMRELMRALESLVEQGLVRYIGVSNFSVELVEEARSYLSREDIVANEVKYSLRDRRVEKDLLPYAQKEKITIIAYTPLEKGSLARDKTLAKIGEKYGKTAAQVALNWLISKPGVVAIPKAGREDHLRENAGAMGWRLSKEDIGYLNRLY
ncbi:MAG: aldo/keto reductase [Candidatus Njordarchaeales archaeon]